MSDPGGFLRPASFRGVPFFARRDVKPYARSLQVDEYPLSDRWSVLDLGGKAVLYRVDAYVADEVNAEARQRALEAALRAPGPGMLILPSRRPVMAWARAPEDEWDGSKLGYFSFKIEFVEDGGAAISGPSLGLAERIIVDGLTQIAAIAVATSTQLAGRSSDPLGVARYEAAAFSAEAEARLVALKAQALGITADNEVVAAVNVARGWQGQADIAGSLSLIGDSGLTVLEELATP